MSNIKEETLKVEVKIESNLDNEFLPENKHQVCNSIDSMIDDYSRFKVKKEFDYGDDLNTDSLKQVNASFKYKEEIKDEGQSEICNEFITENQQHVEEFLKNSETDEKIDISQTTLQSSDYSNDKFELERESDQKAITHEATDKKDLDHQVHNEVKMKKIICDFCKASFTLKRSLHAHILTKHKDNIKNNIKSFITSKIHKCNICNSFESISKWRLDQHINSAHNEVKIKMKCQLCTESFMSKKSLDGHILRKHRDQIKNNIKSFITSKMHVCKICNSYETTHKSSLDHHINSFHNETKIKVKCQFCTKLFIFKQSLDEHVLRKHKDKNNIKSSITNKIQVCKICNSYETTHKWHLDRHIKLIHNKVKIKMKCQFCTESFIKQTSLDAHVLKKHKDEIRGDIKAFITSEIYSCTMCLFESINKAVLNKHVKSAHNEKLKCESS